MTRYDREKISLDYFYKNKVKIFQHKKGYRFSVDSPILADFIPVSADSALEVGSGSGVISLLLLYLKKFQFITGIEIQKGLAELTEMSIAENSLQSKFEVINGDFLEISPNYKGIMNIFSNPPYLKTGKGYLSNNEEMRRGRFEIDINLDRLLKGCSSILGKGGNVFLVFPYLRYEELIDIAGMQGLFPVKVRKVFSFENGKPERFLIQLTNSESDLEEIPPLIIYRSVGVYSDEMELILAGR